MDVAVIDWKNVDSRFVRDELYEGISAPKWVDFTSGDHPIDDVAWFCKPNCDHPKTAEDFLKKEVTPMSNFKNKKLGIVSEISPFGDLNTRDPALKKRALKQNIVLGNKDQKYHTDVEDDENRDPNLSFHPSHATKPVKESSFMGGKKMIDGNTPGSESKKTKLRSTMSARNLFSGGDFLSKVADFCSELKRLATGARSKENADGSSQCKEQEGEMKQPLQELPKEKPKDLEITGSNKQQGRKKRIEADIENTLPPILSSKNKGFTSSPQIRTCPPTPQCFSATQGKAMAPSPKPFGQRIQGGGVLKEQNVADKETDAVDVLWFLKPCTLAS